eukprot:6198030-Pleurochrysis_carterae.AAC.2
MRAARSPAPLCSLPIHALSLPLCRSLLLALVRAQALPVLPPLPTASGARPTPHARASSGECVRSLLCARTRKRPLLEPLPLTPALLDSLPQRYTLLLAFPFTFRLLSRAAAFPSRAGNSPDRTAYFRVLASTLSVFSMLVMIQPTLVAYTLGRKPTPLPLDGAAMAQDRILMLDSFTQAATRARESCASRSFAHAHAHKHEHARLWRERARA